MTITAFSNSCILYVFVVNRHLIVLFMAGIVTLQRLIVTGPNGAGKSYLAAKLAAIRPDVPIISFDNIKLIKNWEQRPKSQIEVKLLQALQSDAWILEGGPSLLPYAIPYADSLIWLDPPRWVRAWRLAIRPLLNFGRVRPELPAGNIDWPWEQYRFAIRSLRNQTKFQENISSQLAVADNMHVWRVRKSGEISSVINAWRMAAA